ncbi:MAG: hypothetical protein L6R19_04575 [Alphaproteobacteria bacterium]|nr:hypothetical protein [Alphaproteobacteria bacterium]
MNQPRDSVGDLLREFYRTFGMPDECPPPDVNVTTAFGDHVPPEEVDILRAALADNAARRQLHNCRALLDDLATRLTSEELLRELSGIALPAGRSVEELSLGVFWFALAGALDRRDSGLPVTPFDAKIDLPLPLKVQMTIQGSLVLRLYIALVYMREGVLAELIAASARAGGPCSGQIRRLLASDFVRRVRNALSHGSFSPCVAGLVFRDDDGAVVATPGMLNWLCTWLNLIQLQALAAGARSPHVSS